MRKESGVLRFKLLSIFTLFCLLPMLSVAVYSYHHIADQLESSVLSNLEAIAKIKSGQIDRFYQRVNVEIETLQNFPGIRKIVAMHTKTKNNTQKLQYEELRRFVTAQLEGYIAKREIAEAHVLSMEGEMLVCSVLEDTPDGASFDEKAIEAGKKSIYISDIYRGHLQNRSYLFTVSAPIKDTDGNTIGVLVAEIVADSFFEQMQDATGLGNSGETLLAKKFGERVVFLNPLRHDPNAALSRYALTDGQLAQPALRGASGQTGSGTAIDYRGEEVIAAWRYIPSFGWGMVAKIDTQEALKPLEQIRDSIVLTALMLFIFGIVASFKVALDLMNPVENLEMQASHDSLTGLPNRMLLTDLLQQALSKAKFDDTLVGVMFLDLDGFKSVNDSHGHKIGDLLLQEVATRLSKCIRQSDTVARLGGDEFVVLLGGIKEMENITNLANNIIKSLNEEFIVGGVSTGVGVSIGISIYPKDGERAEDVLRRADKAMYEAKMSGKNNYKLVSSWTVVLSSIVLVI